MTAAVDLSVPQVTAKSVQSTIITLDPTHAYLRIEPVLTSVDFIVGQSIDIKSEWFDGTGTLLHTETDTVNTGPLGDGNPPFVSVMFTQFDGNGQPTTFNGGTRKFRATAAVSGSAVPIGLRIVTATDYPGAPTATAVPVGNPIPAPIKITTAVIG
jgi:hypothetical protein